MMFKHLEDAILRPFQDARQVKTGVDLNYVPSSRPGVSLETAL